VLGTILREEDELGQRAALGRFGQDSQPFGQEQPFVAAVPLLTERADALDQWIGEGGDLAGQGGGSVASSFQRKLESHFSDVRESRK
jgi:hypothetical protein